MSKPSEEELAERQKRCLDEHLPYERAMLGYTFARLHDTAEGLGWNMAYEAFGIHARTLYDFLRNRGTAGNDFRADQFTRSWSPPSANSDFTDLNTFIAHFSKQRELRPKLTLAKLQNLGAWLDKEWARWVRVLPPETAAFLSADGVCVPPPVLSNGVTTATACTVVTAVTFSTQQEQGR